MNGFERRKEQKKNDIRRAALELFAQYGFKKVSINDIARKADVSPVTIYNHFGSKDGLTKEAVKLQMSDMMDKYRAVIKGKGTFSDKLQAIVFDKIGIASQFKGELAEMVLQKDTELQQYLNDILMHDAIIMMMELFEEGKNTGYIGKDISDETLLIYLDILRSGIASSNKLNVDEKSYPRMVKELNQLFLYGLINTDGKDKLNLVK
jgi:AcrR family transcriptional regulator